ncbi:putative membrane protein [Candidatus Ichthyocystis hellenicum]|uniref:Putative membrane protein n=1 Tax=Candidatus Ichthyocystis hellenicum TaxID=1561003 RepID=A0A0S4LZY1_9BURK|nr:hypothetical protein [Candidatus Ichthyocystis hellenicum]CUT17111.1 putative membrane protein [Candidatus Ichthyocystis hellenicum]
MAQMSGLIGYGSYNQSRILSSPDSDDTELIEVVCETPQDFTTTSSILLKGTECNALIKNNRRSILHNVNCVPRSRNIVSKIFLAASVSYTALHTIMALTGENYSKPYILLLLFAAICFVLIEPKRLRT